ncbi:hypothetical protein [Altererythrobacter sp.]|uniref:hypothetical protein n=1 Tax=Altererythrobacter sp. TaxID=1872480 RepID=UPI003CFD7BB9
MTELGDENDPDNSPLDASARAEFDQSGLILLFALVPAGLILLVLSAIFGDIVWTLGPAALVLGFVGFRVWIIYRHRIENPGPWRGLGERLFPGENRRAQMRNLALVLFGMIVASLTVSLYLPRALIWLRETLFAWTVPWPW